MKRKMRTYRITSAILMVICVVLLIKSNLHNIEKADIIDKYFDLQSEYDKIYDDVQQLEVYSERLENQIDILSSFIADSEYEIDTATNGKEVVR
jgi:peptidoglycan hydrolase CwlO-like protein